MKNVKLVIVLMLFAGCLGWGDIEPPSEPVTEEELVGTYVANYRAGLAETIELRADSTYIYYFKAKDDKEYIDTSRWELYNEGHQPTRPRLILRHFIHRYSLDASCYSPHGRAVLDTVVRDYRPYVYKKSGRIALKRCPKRNQYYIKQE